MTKSFSWSFSKLKNFETCPKRHYEVDIAKNFSDDEGEALVWGNQVHKAFAECLGKGIALPPEMASYQHWIDRVKAGPGKLLVEQKYAITKDFLPAAWFAPNVWYRGIGDVVRLDPAVNPTVGLALDWKTGKILQDSVQLMLLAQCLFSTFPTLKRVRSEFVWLKDDCSTPEVFSRQDVANGWAGMLSRVEALEHAAETLTYPPKPGRLCRKWCPVKSCPYHGRGSF